MPYITGQLEQDVGLISRDLPCEANNGAPPSESEELGNGGRGGLFIVLGARLGGSLGGSLG